MIAKVYHYPYIFYNMLTRYLIIVHSIRYRCFQLAQVLFLRPSKRQKCKLFDFVCVHSFTHYSMSSIYHTAWRNLVVSIFFIRFLILFAMKHGVTLYHFPFYKRIEYLNMEHYTSTYRGAFSSSTRLLHIFQYLW